MLAHLAAFPVSGERRSSELSMARCRTDWSHIGDKLVLEGVNHMPRSLIGHLVTPKGSKEHPWCMAMGATARSMSGCHGSEEARCEAISLSLYPLFGCARKCPRRIALSTPTAHKHK